MKSVRYFSKNIFTVIGLVMVWRGVWYLLDSFDIFYLSGNHFWSGVFGIAIGVAMLYFPDKDLKEIEKL